MKTLSSFFALMLVFAMQSAHATGGESVASLNLDSLLVVEQDTEEISLEEKISMSSDAILEGKAAEPGEEIKLPLENLKAVEEEPEMQRTAVPFVIEADPMRQL